MARNTAIIRERLKTMPRIGIVLGSGLGNLVDSIVDPISIPYGELQDFPAVSVSGQAGALIGGRIGAVPIAALAGRAHYYEDGRSDRMRTALATLKAFSVDALILTNSAGSLREEIPPGSVMLITDHINFANRNPLIGQEGDARFVGMTQAYDPGLRMAALAAADAERLELPQGVYVWFSGPSFETPAEIRAARALGADAAGMSTVPEVILARFMGLRVLAFSVITNYAAGMTGAELSHAETKEMAPRGGAKLARIVTRMAAAWDQAAAHPAPAPSR